MKKGDNWLEKVSDFRKKLKEGKSYYSIKDLCIFLSKEKFKNVSEVVRYLRDYIKISKEKYKFHRKWTKFKNMSNIADYEKKEINMVEKLISFLIK